MFDEEKDVLKEHKELVQAMCYLTTRMMAFSSHVWEDTPYEDVKEEMEDFLRFAHGSIDGGARAFLKSYAEMCGEGESDE